MSEKGKEKTRMWKRHFSSNWWFWVAGLFAFLWVMLRSGTNPKRLTYPCQRAAFPLASSWLVAILGLLGGALLWKRFAKFSAAAASLMLVAFLGASPGLAESRPVPASLPVWEVETPVSTVFVMDSLPPTSGSLAAGDASVPDEHLSDPTMDTLLEMMQAKGTYLHRTAEHPDGIVGSTDVVIIKGNFQWNSQNTTNTDRIKGLIWQILNHPQGFSGEIIVADNTQNIGTGINQNDNNSDDTEQSIPDVVSTFYAKGYPVYYLDWVYIWDDVAEEYSEGDNSDGYVYRTPERITYPKFRTPSGNYYVSLSKGVWDPDSAIYDSSSLCIIDFPVLKAHSWAGATIAVKNWIGVVTTAYSDERFGGFNAMHDDFFFSTYALVARVMAVTYPRLTIVDAAWTTTQGPSNLANIVKTNMLAASTDPVASSWYTAKFILTPIAVSPNATDPDNEFGTYHRGLTNWTTFLADSAGLPCTMDSARISVYDRSVIPEPGVAESSHIEAGMSIEYLSGTTSVVRFSLPRDGHAKLVIVDTAGRIVRTLAEGQRTRGHYSIRWAGDDDRGQTMNAGVYFARLQVGELEKTQKVLVFK